MNIITALIISAIILITINIYRYSKKHKIDFENLKVVPSYDKENNKTYFNLEYILKYKNSIKRITYKTFDSEIKAQNQLDKLIRIQNARKKIEHYKRIKRI